MNSDNRKKHQNNSNDDEYFWQFRGIDFVRRSKSCIYEPIPTGSQQEKHTGPEPKVPLVLVRNEKSWFEVSIAFAGWLISLATLGVIGIYTYFAGGQWEQMIAAGQQTQQIITKTGEAIIQSKLNSYLDQRAWVSLLNVSGTPQTNKPLEILAELSNTGKTPAINVYMRGSVEPQDPLPNVFVRCSQAVKLKESRVLIAPNAHPSLPLSLTKDSPLPEGWEKKIPPKTKIYAFGCVVYDDIFSDPKWEHRHWVTYCGVASDLKEGVPIRFVACKTGNDTGDGEPPKN